jgi:hypothetical protein
MVSLLDEVPISNAVLPDTEYEAVKSILIAGLDRINQMQKLTVNAETELTVISKPK